MKRFIFYFFSLIMYGFLLLSNIENPSIVSIVLILYLIVFSILMLKNNNYNFFCSVAFYINSLVVYPVLLNGYTSNVSDKLAISIFILLLFYIVCGFIDINRELIIFSLLILTLNCSLFDLYINVYKFKEENILFMGVINYLWFTCNTSVKIAKRPKKKKISKM